jgi:hypothetical protein
LLSLRRLQSLADVFPSQARWDDVLPNLSRDSRFTSSSLPSHEQRRLFDAHLRNLYTKRLNLVEGLFLANSPTLTTPFTTILPSITENPHVKSLVGTDYDRLELLFDSWSRKRTEKARADFEQMMKESAILEHWGRLQKKEDTEGDKKLAIGQDGEEEDEDEGDDVPTLTEMAKQVDLKAIHAVLKVSSSLLVPFARHWAHSLLAYSTTSATSSSTTIPSAETSGSRTTCATSPLPSRLCTKRSRHHSHTPS